MRSTRANWPMVVSAKAALTSMLGSVPRPRYMRSRDRCPAWSWSEASRGVKYIESTELQQLSEEVFEHGEEEGELTESSDHTSRTSLAICRKPKGPYTPKLAVPCAVCPECDRVVDVYRVSSEKADRCQSRGMSGELQRERLYK